MTPTPDIAEQIAAVQHAVEFLEYTKHTALNQHLHAPEVAALNGAVATLQRHGRTMAVIDAARELLSAHGKLRVAAAVALLTGLDTESGTEIQKAQDEGASASDKVVEALAALDAAAPETPSEG